MVCRAADELSAKKAWARVAFVVMGVGEPVIATAGLSMRFGKTAALDAVDIEIKSGITGLVGANGAGKSTLLKLVLGLLEPTEGAIETLGRDPQTDGAQVRSRIGYFPERNVLPDTMPADEFVKHMTQLRGLPRSQARSRSSDALWSVGLGEERFRTLGTMSTGQRQRVKLAQALAADPTLILLDEPTDGLDPVQRDSMLDLIVEVRERHGVDIVMSSHVLGEVEKVCTEVVALDGGKVSMVGHIDELLGRRRSAGSAPTATVERELAQVSLELLDGDAVKRMLQEAGCSIEMDGPIMIVTAPPDLLSPAADLIEQQQHEYDLLCDLCRDAIADSGAHLRGMGVRTRTLEEAVFAASSTPDGSTPDSDTPGNGTA